MTLHNLLIAAVVVLIIVAFIEVPHWLRRLRSSVRRALVSQPEPQRLQQPLRETRRDASSGAYPPFVPDDRAQFRANELRVEDRAEDGGRDEDEVEEEAAEEEEATEEETADQLIAQGDEQMANFQYDDAIDSYESAVRKLEAEHGDGALELVGAVIKVGKAYQARDDSVDDDDTYSDEYRRALKIIEEQLGSDHADLLPVLQLLIAAADQNVDTDEAETLLERWTAITESTGVSTTQAARSSTSSKKTAKLPVTGDAEDLADESSIVDCGSYTSAYRRAFALLEQLRGPFHTELLVVLQILIAAERQNGEDDNEETLIERWQVIAESSDSQRALAARGPEWTEEIADAASSGDQQMDDGEASDACQSYEGAFSGLYDDYRSDSLVLADLWLKYGLAIQARDYEEDDGDATTPLHYSRALAIQEQHYGPLDARLVPALRSLASFYDQVGLYKKANYYLDRIRTIADAG